MSITVHFACGHAITIGLNAEPPVCCCGEARIVRTVARAPRFVGACSGPYAETKALDPAVVNVASGGTLRLKTEES